MLKENATLLVLCLLFNAGHAAKECNSSLIEIESIQSRVLLLKSQIIKSAIFMQNFKSLSSLKGLRYTQSLSK
jgi:hypothetical protein